MVVIGAINRFKNIYQDISIMNPNIVKQELEQLRGLPVQDGDDAVDVYTSHILFEYEYYVSQNYMENKLIFSFMKWLPHHYDEIEEYDLIKYVGEE